MKRAAELEKEIAGLLVGAWRLVTRFEIEADGERAYPLGRGCYRTDYLQRRWPHGGSTNVDWDRTIPFARLARGLRDRKRFEDSRLILDADTAWGRVQIVWERFDAGSSSQPQTT